MCTVGFFFFLTREKDYLGIVEDEVVHFLLNNTCSCMVCDFTACGELSSPRECRATQLLVNFGGFISDGHGEIPGGMGR